LIASVIYALWLVQRSVFGPNDNDWILPDLSAREVVTLGVLAVMLLWLGVYPQPVFDTASHSMLAAQRTEVRR
jgi:NADH-quinone oxidoreductase subunit M